MCCDYALKMALPKINDEIKQEMEELSTAEYGVNTFACFMAGKDLMMNDSEMIESFDTVSKIGGVTFVHAENGDVVHEGERKMIAAGVTGPEGHAMAHPEEAEVGFSYSIYLINMCFAVRGCHASLCSCKPNWMSTCA